MNILIKGFGSIGRRHYEVLKDLYPQTHIDIISSKNIPHAFRSFQDINDLNFYDYFVIATPTSEHYSDLLFLDQKVKNKIIFMEKPLFSKKENFFQTCNNQIYIGYVLRFHPLIQQAKKLIKQHHAYFVEVSSESYLPDWRPNSDYRKIYSARSELGGGVLLDLSHEIDYLRWIFGDFEEIRGINTRISELEIDTDDLATFIVTTSQKTIINLTLNYFSKIPKRSILIHTSTFSLEIDLLNNRMKQIDTHKNTKETILEIERNDLFKKMHANTLESQEKILPNLNEGARIMDELSRMKNAN